MLREFWKSNRFFRGVRRRSGPSRPLNRLSTGQRRAHVESLESRVVLASGDPFISEFQAINASTLQDEDGDYEDWIEISNPDSTPRNLGNWYLTDDQNDLLKWRIPSGTVLEPGEHLVVFASNKDRDDGPENQLHTNFRLSGDGEYLALVTPLGVVSHAYAPAYPPQIADQSYGIGVGRDTYELLPNESSATAHVPADNVLGTTWTQSDFNDASWRSGVSAVGFEELNPAYEVNEAFDNPLNDDWTVDIPPEGTSTVSVTGGVLRLDVPVGQGLSASDRRTAPMVYRELPGPGIDYEITTRVTQGEDERGAAGIVVVDGNTSLPAIQLEYSSRSSFRFLAGGSLVESRINTGQHTYALRLVRDGIEKTWTAYSRIDDADDWQLVGVATDGVDTTPVLTSLRLGTYALHEYRRDQG